MRRDENASASSRSRAASSSELPTSVSMPRSRTTVSSPRSTAAWNGLATSSKTTPMLVEVRSARRRLDAEASRR